jgi:hypothetical protein
MYLSGVGAEQHTQVFQSLLAGNRPVSGIQKIDKDGDGDHDKPGKKVQPVSPAVQDQVTLSREAQNLAGTASQNQKAGQGTLQDSRSPFDR